jgi:hypothetical protein
MDQVSINQPPVKTLFVVPPKRYEKIHSTSTTNPPHGTPDIVRIES